jgi:hypothetical protein
VALDELQGLGLVAIAASDCSAEPFVVAAKTFLALQVLVEMHAYCALAEHMLGLAEHMLDLAEHMLDLAEHMLDLAECMLDLAEHMPGLTPSHDFGTPLGYPPAELPPVFLDVSLCTPQWL